MQNFQCRVKKTCNLSLILHTLGKLLVWIYYISKIKTLQNFFILFFLNSLHFWHLQVPVWSGVNLAGVRLRDLDETVGTANDTQGWNEIHNQVVKGGSEVRNLKGYTSWAIGLSVSDLTAAILRNTNQVHAVSTMVKVRTWNFNKNIIFNKNIQKF